MAQAIQPYIDRPVHVGHFGHEANHEAMLRGDLDLYAEYDGTALHRYLKLAPKARDEVHSTVQQAARERWNVEWLEPFGSDNTYGVMMHAPRARELGIQTISDLAAQAANLTLTASEQYFAGNPPLTFAPGGYPGFIQAYGFQFGHSAPATQEYSAPFRVLERGEADVVADFVVNPYVEALDLVEIADDRQIFTTYYITPVVRGEFLAQYPIVRTILQGLAWTIDSRAMARYNYLMEFQSCDPVDLAREFLATHSKHQSSTPSKG